MKKSFLLIEVLISIMLISAVILALFKIKDNNLYFLEKHSNRAELNSFVSLVALNSKDITIKNHNVYLSDIVDFEDEEIRRLLKDIKVKTKQNKIREEKISKEGITIDLQKHGNSYSIDNKILKKTYKIKIN